MTGRTKRPPELSGAGLWVGGGVMGGAMGAETSTASGDRGMGVGRDICCARLWSVGWSYGV